jgi:hypothetical protein
VTVVVDGERHDLDVVPDRLPAVAARLQLPETAWIGFSVAIQLGHAPRLAVGILLRHEGGATSHLSQHATFEAEFAAHIDVEGEGNSVAGSPKEFLASAVTISGQGNAIWLGEGLRMLSARLHVLGRQNRVTIGDNVSLSGDLLVHGDGHQVTIGDRSAVTPGSSIALTGQKAVLEVSAATVVDQRVLVSSGQSLQFG